MNGVEENPILMNDNALDMMAAKEETNGKKKG